LAEYYNTVSNIPFVLAPILFWWLFREYAQRVESKIWVVWLLLSVIGISSGLFHATLSFATQMLDELSILWLMLGGLALFTGRWQIPLHFVNGDRTQWRWFLLGAGVMLSLLGFLRPKLNAFLLFVGVVPITFTVSRALLRGHACGTPFNQRVWLVAWACIGSWIVAISCWIADKQVFSSLGRLVLNWSLILFQFCKFWSEQHFPYPQWHAIWHLIVLVAGYLVLLLGAFFLACEEAPHLGPRIDFWPVQTRFGFAHWMGVPFVKFHSTQPPELQRSSTTSKTD
jgi:hypothetical protein